MNVYVPISLTETKVFEVVNEAKKGDYLVSTRAKFISFDIYRMAATPPSNFPYFLDGWMRYSSNMPQTLDQLHLSYETNRPIILRPLESIHASPLVIEREGDSGFIYIGHAIVTRPRDIVCSDYFAKKSGGVRKVYDDYDISCGSSHVVIAENGGWDGSPWKRVKEQVNAAGCIADCCLRFVPNLNDFSTAKFTINPIWIREQIKAKPTPQPMARSIQSPISFRSPLPLP